jgi:transposase
LQRVVVEDVQIGSEDQIVVAVRPVGREQDRCGVCRRRSPGFDQGEGRRRWRGLDLGMTLAFVEAEAPRVTCRRHGVVVCAVPWARHDSRFTRAFEDQTAWLAVNAWASPERFTVTAISAIGERYCQITAKWVVSADGVADRHAQQPAVDAHASAVRGRRMERCGRWADV